MKKNLYTLGFVLAALVLSNCGNNTSYNGFNAASVLLTILDDNKDPVEGATVWTLGNTTPSGISIQDPRGPVCAAPTSNYGVAGCTDADGLIIIFCTRTEETTIKILNAGVETTEAIICTGESEEIKL